MHFNEKTFLWRKTMDVAEAKIINLTLSSLMSRSRSDIVNAIRILPHSCALYF